jgi:hypothetical protein
MSGSDRRGPRPSEIAIGRAPNSRDDTTEPPLRTLRRVAGMVAMFAALAACGEDPVLVERTPTDTTSVGGPGV